MASTRARRGSSAIRDACSSFIEFELSTMSSTSSSPLAWVQQSSPAHAEPTKALLKWRDCATAMRPWTSVGRAT